MNFMSAIKAAIEGKKITRHSWDRGSYLRQCCSQPDINKKDFIKVRETDSYHWVYYFTYGDFTANDWKIYREKLK